ncbi:MAG: GntR family transcriptional regulator [Deltaproteobacteria bacterium]|nr:GntR family transcriptional regulator [Deltaproteobacteria bacterium]
MPDSRLKRLTLKEQAYRSLRDMIASHRFSSGKWINLEQLSKELGVSRTPVQQAMKQLEKEGLVTHVPNQGIRMAVMTLEMARDLYQVREVLEGLAAALAAERIDQETVSRMKRVLAEQAAIIREKDLLAYSVSDFKFHQLIYDSCGNWLLKEQLDIIKRRSRPLVCDVTPILPDLVADHQQVVEAFRKKDPRQAEQAMRRHNRRMREIIAEASGGSDRTEAPGIRLRKPRVKNI